MLQLANSMCIGKSLFIFWAKKTNSILVTQENGWMTFWSRSSRVKWSGEHLLHFPK